MKFTFSVLTILAVLGLVSCDKFKVTTTKDGDRLQIHKEGKSGKVGKDGDIISFDLIIKTAADSVIKDSYKEGQPFIVPIQKGTFKGSFENALYHIGEGDSTTVLVNADSLFKLMGQPLSPGIAKGSDLKFIVKMHKVQTRAEFEKEAADKKSLEPKTVADFAAKSMKNALKTAEGIYYTENSLGAGATPIDGETVVVEYVGKFMDGKIFDQSNGQPFEVPLGQSKVIPGWEFALKTMKKGGKSTFIIPSALAYGEQGGGPIPPNTPLVFDITLTDIKK